jgi:hypothetical protein
VTEIRRKPVTLRIRQPETHSQAIDAAVTADTSHWIAHQTQSSRSSPPMTRMKNDHAVVNDSNRNASAILLASIDATGTVYASDTAALHGQIFNH